MNQHHVEALKGARMKATPKRLAIIDILAAQSCYASPEELWKKLRDRFDHLGLPTIYRNLEELAASGIVIKVVHPNRQLYYYLPQNPDYHYLFVCLDCRGVEEIADCDLEALEHTVLQRNGGRVLSRVLQLNGLCGGCVEKGRKPLPA